MKRNMNFFDTCKYIYQVDGLKRFWRGASIIASGCIPAHAAYFSIFEASKNKVFSTAKEKNEWKIFLLDWLQPNIPLSALHYIKSPSLIIGGDHDLIPASHTVVIYQNIPQAYLWILPNSGHGTLLEYALRHPPMC